MSSQFFSKMYYGSQVWLTTATISHLWTLINSLHYWAVHVAVCDYKGHNNWEKLYIQSSRASPKQRSIYSIASIIIKILRDGIPLALYNIIIETLYEEWRQPGIWRLCDNLKGKVGKKKICNNVQYMMAIKNPWLGKKWTNDYIRTELKAAFSVICQSDLTWQSIRAGLIMPYF